MVPEKKVVTVTIAFSSILVELQFPLIFGKRVESKTSNTFGQESKGMLNAFLKLTSHSLYG